MNQYIGANKHKEKTLPAMNESVHKNKTHESLTKDHVVH